MSSPTLETVSQDFFKTCTELAEFINAHEDDLLHILTRYETFEAARDEISRSVQTLHGMEAEMSTLKKPLRDLNIATLFPLNLPLYSLIIFGIAPSLFAKNIYIRPPEVMRAILVELWDVLDIDNHFPVISLHPTPRQVFIQLYASECDVIIFTGKYENALAIHQQCPYALLIYNGSGVNPFILLADADVDLAAHKAIEMRCFNSGQDCAGPDAFLVPSSLAEAFIKKLELGLKEIKVGNTSDPAVRIGPTVKEAYIAELQTWLKHRQSNVVFGGKIDLQNRLVYPTIIREQIDGERAYKFHEFFAPYFYVLTYDTIKELQHVIASPAFQNRGMYVSLFGNNPSVEASLTFVQVLKNLIVNDVEQGNQQYGGFGSQANFLLYGNKKTAHPLLISRDMHTALIQ